MNIIYWPPRIAKRKDVYVQQVGRCSLYNNCYIKIKY